MCGIYRRHRHLLECFFIVGECSFRCVGRFTAEGSSFWLWLWLCICWMVICCCSYLSCAFTTSLIRSFVRLLARLPWLTSFWLTQHNNNRRVFSPFFLYPYAVRWKLRCFPLQTTLTTPFGCAVPCCFVYCIPQQFQFHLNGSKASE